MKFRKIRSIEKIGIKETYDIAMKTPNNNYIANGIVVHNSSLARKLMDEIQPDNFEELSAVSALLRPGPLRMGMDSEFADRKFNRKIEGKDYEIPECIRDILGYTYGVIVYQEEFMLIANKIGGLSKAETNAFRKALVKYGKSAEKEAKRYAQVESYHNKFIANASKPEFLGDKLKAEELWQLIASFAQYGFNKCIYFKEKVQDRDRGTITLEDVQKLKAQSEEVWIKSADKNGKAIWVEVVDVYDNGIKDLVKVEMENGTIIRCTLDHKFRTLEGMLPLKEIISRELDILTDTISTES